MCTGGWGAGGRRGGGKVRIEAEGRYWPAAAAAAAATTWAKVDQYIKDNKVNLLSSGDMCLCAGVWGAGKGEGG